MSRFRMKMRWQGHGTPPAPPPPPAGDTLTLYTHERTPIALAGVSDVAGPVATFLGLVADGNNVTATLGGASAASMDLTTGLLYVEGTNVVGAPPAAYDGTEGSGFAGAPPVAETRTTAKPVCKLLTVWRQAFTDKIVLMIAAEAKGGIDHVDVMVEGTTLTLNAPALYQYADVNGRPKWFYGYVAELDAANYLTFGTDATRGVRVFIRAVPSDPNMQSQLIGDAANENEQYVFFPVSQAHDFLIEVNPDAASNTEPAGAYPAAHAIVTRLDDAIAYAGGTSIATIGAPGVTMRRPLILIKKSGFYDWISAAGNSSNGRGYCTVTTDTGVIAEIGRAAYDGTKLSWRLGFNGVEFRGQGIKFNSTNWTAISYDTGATGAWRHWMNGIISTADIDFSQYLDDHGRARYGNVQGGRCPTTHFQTDCDLSYTSGGSAWISRGNVRRHVLGDLYTRTLAIWGDRVYGFSPAPFRTNKDSFSLVYNGSGAATYAKSGSSGTDGCKVTLKVDGVTVASYSLDTYWNAGLLVAQINADLGPDWSATSLVTPNDRVTDRHLSYLGTTGGIALTTGVARTLTTFIDAHVDLAQFFGGWVDNVYVGKVVIFEAAVLQFLFEDVSGLDALLEDIFCQNAGGTKSQIGKSSIGTPYHFSHVRHLGCSDIGNTAQFNNGDDTWDDYCDFSNCYFNSFAWQSTTTNNATPVLTDCHFANAYADSGLQVSVNVTSGGSMATNFPKVGNLDPQPGGTLAATTAEGEVSAYDVLGVKRPANPVKGPKVFGLASGVALTKAEVGQLAVIARDDTTGTNVATLTLSGKDGAGETGSVVSLTLQLDVAGLGLAA